MSAIQMKVNGRNHRLDAEADMPLLYALRNDLQLHGTRFGCGKGQCGACHLYVLEGRKSLSKIQRTENEKLDTMVGVSSKSRLACQTTLGEEPVTIELLSFV